MFHIYVDLTLLVELFSLLDYHLAMTCSQLLDLLEAHHDLLDLVDWCKPLGPIVGRQLGGGLQQPAGLSGLGGQPAGLGSGLAGGSQQPAGLGSGLGSDLVVDLVEARSNLLNLVVEFLEARNLLDLVDLVSEVVLCFPSSALLILGRKKIQFYVV